MFKAGDRVRIKPLNSIAIFIALHPTENRTLQPGDELDVLFTGDDDNGTMIFYRVVGNTKYYEYNKLHFHGVDLIGTEYCQLIIPSKQVTTDTMCICKSLLFGHDAGCPLNKGN